MKRAIVTVSNDLSTDRRVHRTCLSLNKLGFNALLIGRKRRNSLPLEQRIYRTKRIKLLFNKGFAFYAELNIRLFFFLLFRKCDLYFANDLDTLLPNYLAKKIRRKKIIYDSHEYFTGVPELQGRPFVQKVWQLIERRIFPKLSDIITVNDSIARLYSDKYKKNLIVVRNIPDSYEVKSFKSKEELGIQADKSMIILQGSGINIDRGAEEAVLSMQFVENAILYIIGDGDVISTLKQMVNDYNLTEKVSFIPKQPMSELIHYTHHADIGLTLDKGTNLNYRYSLPNKLFDYIYAGVPVLASALVEVEKIVNKYKVGEIVHGPEPEKIAQKISAMLSQPDVLRIMKENCKFAAFELNWEDEEKKLLEILAKHA